MRKGVLYSAVLFISGLFFTLSFADAPAPGDSRKHTVLGKYVTSIEAFEMWKAAPEKVKVIDVRTPEEYVFVGHPLMAVNVPFELWTGDWNAGKKSFSFALNTEFETRVRHQAGLQDTILVMCRSGHRAAVAVNYLAKAGFTNVYNVVDGFEGDPVMEEDSYFAGKRVKNGWSNSRLPWTYRLEPELVYIP